MSEQASQPVIEIRDVAKVYRMGDVEVHALRGASLKGRRLALLRTVVLDEMQDEPRAGFDAAVGRLEAAGATTEALDMPGVAEAIGLAAILFTAEAYGLWRDVIEANPDAMFDQIRERFRSGRAFSGPDYVAAWARLHEIRKAWMRATAGFDAVVCPTAPNLPPDLERLMRDHDYYVNENLLTLRNTRIGSLMGVCALSLPTGAPSCGLQLLGRAGGEEALLRIGAAAEAALT